MGTIGVEDSCNFDRESVLAKVVEEKGLGASFSFVIAGAWSDRVDIAEVVFGLLVHEGVAIYFTGRGEQDSRIFFMS